MSQIFEALQQSNAIKGGNGLPIDLGPAVDEFREAMPSVESLDEVPAVKVAASPERRLVAMFEERSLGSEKIRMLAAKLRQLQQRRPIKKLLISSSIKDEGKSLVASNLAVALAKAKQRVLLLDGDLHQPQIAASFGMREPIGLSSWWRSSDSIMNHVRRIEGLPAWLLAAGEPSEHSLEVLQSERMAQLLDQLSDWFDWVIIDSPPLAPLADSGVWISLCDACILVIRSGKTPKKVLAKVLDSVDKSKLLGIALNDSADPDLKFYKQYYSGASNRAKSSTA